MWLLQIVAEMVRNLVMAYVYCISKLVGNISDGRCGVIQDVCYEKEDGRETIVDQRNMDIGNAADVRSTCTKSYQQRFEPLIY